MVRFVTPDMGARISGGHTSMGPSRRGAMVTAPPTISWATRTPIGRGPRARRRQPAPGARRRMRPLCFLADSQRSLEEPESRETEMRIDGVHDRRLLRNDLGQTAGGDHLCASTQLGTHSRYDRLGLSDE